ncbi:MAG: hypothetical protein IKO27_05060 [Ruminococcus sp.]|nr:hypothetical protein [Ruminococcus sp.]
MLLKRLICAASAVVTAVSFMSSAVFAAKDEEKKEIPFKADMTMTSTEAGIPSLSFDNDYWTDYVHMTADSEKIGLKIIQDKKTYYQGFSLKATASGSQNSELYQCAGYIRDSDNNPVYPDAEKEDAKFICPGVELRCEDFGLSCFDGCFLTFVYKIGTDAKDKLMGSKIFAFATDDTYQKTLSNVLALEYDDLLDNNVSQYRNQSITVPANASATRIVFETPVMENMDSDVLCLDNICIMLPDGTDKKPCYIKNLDGYNANAEPQEMIEAIQIQEKSASRAEIADAPEKQGSSSTGVIIIIAIAVVGLGAAGVVFYIIRKKKFY